MRNRYSILLLAPVVALLSCGDETHPPFVPQGVDPRTRAVLVPFENAWNQRDLSAYEAILDDDFTFVLSPRDAGGGAPVGWDRAEDLLITARMFDPAYGITSIAFSLPGGRDAEWEAVVPSPEPGGNWYSTVVFYEFSIATMSVAFIPLPRAHARLTIRNAGSDKNPTWRLVELRDHPDVVASFVVPTPVEETTLGKLKGYYR